MPQAPAPGLVQNPAGNTYQDWLQKFLNWATWKWASSDQNARDTFLGNSWNTAQFGTPDPTASVEVDPVSGQQTVVGQNPMITKSALMNFAQNYKGGDPEIDSAVGQYVPPGLNDYVPSQSQAQQNQAQANWQSNFDAQQAQNRLDQQLNEAKIKLGYDQIAADQGKTAADNWAALERAKVAAQASTYGTQVGAGTNNYGTQMSGYGAQLGALSSLYGTQAGMYNQGLGTQANIFGTLGDIYKTQQSLQQQGISQAGQLGLSAQGLQDARTQSYIADKANPGNFVQAAYEGRALQPPSGYTGPMYQTDPSIQQAISKLLNYQPGPAPSAPNINYAPQPTAPTMPTMPVAPPIPQAPVYSGGGAPVSTGPSPSTGGTPPQFPNLPSTHTTGNTTPNTNLPPGWGTPGGPTGSSAQQNRIFLPQVSTGATGTLSSNLPPGWGTPQGPGNSIAGAPPGWGANSGATGSAAGSLEEILRRANARTAPDPGSTIYEPPSFAMGTAGMTQAPVSMVGDVQADGQPNPEAVLNPTGAPMGVVNKDEVQQLIMELTQELQTVQDPNEQQQIQSLLQQLQQVMAKLESGETPNKEGTEQQGMHQMPGGSMMPNSQMPPTGMAPSQTSAPPQGQMPAFAYGTDYSSTLSNSYAGSSWNPSAPENLGKANPADVAQFKAAQQAQGTPHAYVNWGNPQWDQQYASAIQDLNTGRQTNPQYNGNFGNLMSLPGAPGTGQPGNPSTQYAPNYQSYIDSSTPPSPGQMTLGGGGMNEGQWTNGTTPPLMTNPSYGPGQYTTTSGTGSTPYGQITTYPDSAYQNLPLVKYLQNPQYASTYNTLATGNQQGPFGIQLPETGGLNYRSLLNIANNPIDSAISNSIFQAMSRSLPTELALAKQRAPLGSGLFGSVIRTV